MATTVDLESIIQRIEGSKALERAGNAVRKPVQQLVGEDSLRDALTGKWLGHPVHPTVVVVPIGCWLAAGVLDLVGGRAGRRAAQRLIGIGVLSALPVAATGLADWIDTTGEDQRVGSAHAALNNTALTFFYLSWRSRRRGHQLRGKLNSLLGTAAVAAAGYLGGHLAYRRGVGVNTTAFDRGPTEWADLHLDGAAMVGKAQAARVGDIELVVVHGVHNGDVHALDDRCTHRGGPLHEGELVGNCVKCPWHGSVFDLETGAVQRGPASAPQPAYEVTTRAGTLRARRAQPGDGARSLG